MTTSHRPRRLLVVAALVAGVAVGGIQLTSAASPSTATSVVPVEPYRILDTRLGIGAPLAPVGAGATIDVQIAGVGPVPADAVGVVLNITGTSTTEATYVTAWPSGGVQPTASVLNLTPGIDAPNGVTALLGAGREAVALQLHRLHPPDRRRRRLPRPRRRRRRHPRTAGPRGSCGAAGHVRRPAGDRERGGRRRRVLRGRGRRPVRRGSRPSAVAGTRPTSRSRCCRAARAAPATAG